MPDEPITICGVVKPSRIAFEKRFWVKADKSGDCWEWTGTKMKSGYGRLAVARCVMHLAHRVAWELANRRAVPENLRVLHECDNPSCVNPDHLFVGTAKDNTQDMLRKMRHAHGERHGQATLTAEIVLEARRLFVDGMTVAAIGRKLGLRHGTVSKVVHRQRWVHI